jgi:pyridoxamine 5'-phosphate oxidase
MAGRDPIARFEETLERAKSSEPDVPAAMTLATVDAEGRPSARIVLLRGVDHRGFVFYTNYGSHKARELQQNPHAALCFHWKSLGEQVRVEGTVARVDAAESDAYFASRPQRSQLAAIASKQSEPLESREVLEERFADLAREVGDEPVRRPSYWGGFRIRPRRIEFWKHRDHRLHDRELYEKTNEGWEHTLLYP